MLEYCICRMSSLETPSSQKEGPCRYPPKKRVTCLPQVFPRFNFIEKGSLKLHFYRKRNPYLLSLLPKPASLERGTLQVTFLKD